jgi:hypothetical protein
MRNMLALFAATLLTVVGVGWYLGWYKVTNQPASVPGQHSVQIDFDTHKIGADLQKSEQKLHQIMENKPKDEAKTVPDPKKSSDNLMLPSPLAPPQLSIQPEGGPTLQVGKGDKGPMFQFHSDKGPSFQIGGGKAPLLQFDNGKKGTFIQIGTTDKNDKK